MGEGLIGLIILIVVINVLGRLLKAVTSASRPDGEKGPPRASPPRSKREQQILEELFELERERAGGAVEEGETAEAATVSKSTPLDETAAFEGGAAGAEAKFTGEGPGDLKQWAEERFERTAPPGSYGYREPSEPARAPAEKTAEPAAGASVWGRMGAPSREERSTPDTVRRMLGDVPSLRTAILLSVILGPCRARNRIRRGERIV